MKRVLLTLGIAILLCFALKSTGSQKTATESGKITEFTAKDMPHDDGAGIILSWKPLHRSHRIIAYNVYRGVSPDSLFLHYSVEVDPKQGVLAPELFFYDRGDQPLVEFETSPLSLKREKQQAAGSPLFRKFPQNPSLIATMIGRYNITGAIKSNNLYHKAKPIKTPEGVLAGLKLNKFEYIFGFPIPEQKYYYTVLGVNERGRLLPYADIAEVIPVDNPPTNTASLSSTYIIDTKVINYEWSPPMDSPDIAGWEGWLVPRASLSGSVPQLNNSDGDLGSSNWQSNAIQIFQIPNISGISTGYHSVDTTSEGIALPGNMEDYLPILAYTDYAGQSNAVSAVHHRIISNSDLPKLYPFEVKDKKDDKGDNLVISIGKPIAYVNSAQFTNLHRNTLRINYEISANESHSVNKILFSFYSSGEKKQSVDGNVKTPVGDLIGTATEYYVDKTILFKLPAKYKAIKDLHVQTALVTKGSKVFDPDYTEQHIVYDTTNKLFDSKDISYRGELLSKQYYDILTQSLFSPDFLPGNKTNGITRAYEYNIPYEDIVYQNLVGFDRQTNCLTLDPVLSVDGIPSKGLSFTSSIFRENLMNDLKTQETEINRLKASIATYSKDAVPDSITMALATAQDNHDYITRHPAYKQASLTKSQRQWLKPLLAAHKVNTRRFSFRLLRTDGRGAFVVSDTYTEPNGNSWFMPKSEWFVSTMVITFFTTILLCVLLVYAIIITKRKEVYIRPIAGLQEIDIAIGRATEMGRPVMFVPGWGTIGEVCTIASMMILGQIAKKTSEFDIRLISPHCDYLVLPMAQEIVQSSYSESGRPDAYNQNDIFFVSGEQFPFCAGVNGITLRERVATVFYMGAFYAEALLLTETGNQAGAIQIAGTDSVTQIPFFITTCDFTLIGEEFYAASAYLSRNYELVSMLKAQDYFKLVIVTVVLIGSILSSLHITGFINAFPIE